MKPTEGSILIENYFGLLNSLSKENKIELIARLSNSLVDEAPEKENVIDKYFGAFKSDKSAEEILEEIRNSRSFNRKIEAF